MRNIRRDGNDKIKKMEKDSEVTEDDMSYDVATLAVLDTHNSLNYIAKTDAAVTLNLIMDSVYEGKAIQRT